MTESSKSVLFFVCIPWLFIMVCKVVDKEIRNAKCAVVRYGYPSLIKDAEEKCTNLQVAPPIKMSTEHENLVMRLHPIVFTFLHLGMLYTDVWKVATP